MYDKPVSIDMVIVCPLTTFKFIELDECDLNTSPLLPLVPEVPPVPD